MTASIPVAASGIGSYWWEAALLLKNSIARQGIDLDLNTRTHDYHNVLSVAKGESVLGVTMPQFVDWAGRGLSVFAGEQIPELRVVAAMNLPVWLAAAVDRSTGFTALAELARDQFPWKVVLPAPDNLVGEYIDRIMNEHGLTRAGILNWGGADLRPFIPRTAAQRESAVPLAMNHQTARLAIDGETNGFFLYINGCSPWARDLTTLRDLRFLRFDETILDSINAEWGGMKLTLPERLFRGVDENLPVVGWHHQYVYGTTAVSDDLAEAVLLALEDESILDNAHGLSYSGFRPQLPQGVRLHRATEAYFKRRERA